MFKNAKINLLIASLFSLGAYAADLTTDKIEVISITPLPSIGVSLKEIPSNVQTVKAKDIKDSQALDLSSYMNQNLSSVYINQTQGNPIQGDLNYRGYTASPLLGTPQGLSLYLDGVRMNQPFGDVVSWDLIPKNAIQSVQLMPGSNPLFGLNTLGGAISIQTKDGRTSPGGVLQSSFGSYRRSLSEFEYGGVSKDNSVDYFVAGTYFNEKGWRDQSKSDFGQLFGKIGWQGEKTDAKLSYAYANTDLNGNGLIPQSAYNRDKSSVYTWPDNTQNKSSLLNLNLSHYFSPKTMFSGNVYYRNIRTNTFNGDMNESALPEYYGSSSGQTITSGNIYSAANASGVCLAENGAGDEPGEKCIGAINRGNIKQQNAGFQGQLSMDDKLFGMDNKFIVGAGYDWSKVHYVGSTEYGWLSQGSIGSSIIGSGMFSTQARNAVLDGEIDDRSVNLKGKNQTFSLFLADNLKATDKLNFSGSARYNHTTVDNKDQQIHYGVEGYKYRSVSKYSGSYIYSDDVADMTNGGSNVAYRYYPGGTGYAGQDNDVNTDASLTGKHIFNRINPSLGLTYDLSNKLNMYGGYNEGSRAPTSIELGCANPDNGCRLPNSMAGDPPLKQVVSKTFEVGARGNIDGLRYNLGAYNARNENDIMFVASSVSEGYFKNFGETRRRGIELGLAKEVDRWVFSGNYSFIDATYQSQETVGGTAHSDNGATNNMQTDYYTCVAGTSAANCGTSSGAPSTSVATRTIQINKGNRIPMIPRQMLKLMASYRLNDKSFVGVDTMTVADLYVRGNEDNKAAGGSIGGYTLVNLTASYNPNSQWSIFGRVNNLFDKDYATGGQLGLSPFNSSTGNIMLSGDSSQAVGETFVAPGAPRTAWIGVRFEFGGPAKSQ
jgi:outer membrane receptor protein involved in Fe transport